MPMFSTQPRRRFLQTLLQSCTAGALLPQLSTLFAEEPGQSTRSIPPVPGKLSVALRKRGKEKDAPATTERTEWNASETAIIICDM
ncbi:MAG TPA: hypothetical protein DIT97_04620, partial [Gimesia maris]|nr:hypothetical protein [Gimesia maris]